MLDLTDISFNSLSYDLVNHYFDDYMSNNQRPTLIIITPIQSRHFFRGWKLYRGVKLKIKEEK